MLNVVAESTASLIRPCNPFYVLDKTLLGIFNNVNSIIANLPEDRTQVPNGDGTYDDYFQPTVNTDKRIAANNQLLGFVINWRENFARLQVEARRLGSRFGLADQDVESCLKGTCETLTLMADFQIKASENKGTVSERWTSLTDVYIRTCQYLQELGARLAGKLDAFYPNSNSEIISSEPKQPTPTQSSQGGRKPKPPRRGRPKANEETIRREAEIKERWTRAHESGVQKIDFAEEEGITRSVLDEILDRVYSRNRTRKKKKTPPTNSSE